MNKSKGNNAKDQSKLNSKLKKFWKPDDPGLFCIICENAICNAMKTDCGHHFCSYCIGLWSKNCPLCPICKENMLPLKPNPEMDRDVAKLIAGFSGAAQAERDKFIKVRESKEHKFLARCAEEAVENSNNGSGEGGQSQLSSYGISGYNPNLQPNKKSFTILQKNSPTEKRLSQALNETKHLEKELQAIYSKIINTGTLLNAREDALIAKLCSGKNDEPSFDILPSIGSRSSELSIKGARALTASSSNKNLTRPRSAMVGRPGSRGDIPGNLPQLSSGKDLSSDQLELDDLLELTNDAMELEKFLQSESFDKLTSEDMDFLFDDNGDETNKKPGELELVRAKPTLAPEFKLHPEVEEIVKKCTTKIVPVAPGSSKIKKINFVKDEEHPGSTTNSKQLIRPKTALPGRSSINRGNGQMKSSLSKLSDYSINIGGDGDTLPAKALLTPIAKGTRLNWLKKGSHVPVIHGSTTGKPNLQPIKSRPGTRQ